MFEILPWEWELLEKSNDSTYNTLKSTAMSSQSATTITTYISGIKRIDGPLTYALFKFLYNLREMVAQDSAGRRTVIDPNSSQISSATTNTIYALRGVNSGQTLGAFPDTASTQSQNAQHRLAYKSITLAGGTKADQELVAALTGYKSRCLIRSVTSDTADTYTFLFQDAGDQPIAHPVLARSIVVGTALVPTNFAQPILAVNSTANSAIEVDVSGGAGGEVLEVEYEYWYEA